MATPAQATSLVAVVVVPELLRPGEQVERVQCQISLELLSTMRPADPEDTETHEELPRKVAQTILVALVELQAKTVRPELQIPVLAAAAGNTLALRFMVHQAGQVS